MKTIPITYIDTQHYTAAVEYDQWTDSPAEYGMYRLVTFNRNLTTDCADYDEFFTDNDRPKPSLTAKLRAGKAFWVDIYEHGGMSYSLSGEGMNDRFDTSRRAALLILEDDIAKGVDYAGRAQIARDILDEYTEWANGNCYYVNITDARGEEVESCGGFIGLDAAAAYIRDTLPDTPHANITLAGEVGEWIDL